MTDLFRGTYEKNRYVIFLQKINLPLFPVPRAISANTSSKYEKKADCVIKIKQICPLLCYFPPFRFFDSDRGGSVAVRIVSYLPDY